MCHSCITSARFSALLPGPNSLYVMAAASRWGVSAGYRGAAGIFVGDTILMVLAVTGMASLLRATPELFMVIKYAGAAYLAWVGFSLLRAGLATWRRGSDAAVDDAPDDTKVRGTPHPFRTALVISLMNLHIPVENEHLFRFKMNADSGLRVHRF
ncbi:LysE family transporter, partial [Aeromonas caviae]